NPDDIASITILKDADATAIYGSRGANGVVLIKTKRADEGRSNLSLRLSTGINKAANLPRLLSVNDYLDIRKEAFQNDGRVPSSTPGTSLYAPDILLWDTTKISDWGDFLFGGNADQSDGQLTFKGSNGLTSFSTTLNYRSEGSILQG